MSFSDMVVGKSGLLAGLHCHNSFNEKIYTDITNYLNKHLSEWKSTGFIPVADAVSIFNLIDELSGECQFWSEEAELRAEDAVFEIQEIIIVKCIRLNGILVYHMPVPQPPFVTYYSVNLLSPNYIPNSWSFS